MISDISQDRASLEVLPDLGQLVSPPQLGPQHECISLQLPPSAERHLEENVVLAIELSIIAGTSQRLRKGKKPWPCFFLNYLSIFVTLSWGKVVELKPLNSIPVEIGKVS